MGGMKTIGLVGGVASGKSRVAQMLVELGAGLVDADRAGHAVLAESKDVQQALRDGFTTGTGMGLGLSGAKRLVNEFEIDSAPGRGTKVMIIRWRNT